MDRLKTRLDTIRELICYRFMDVTRVITRREDVMERPNPHLIESPREGKNEGEAIFKEILKDDFQS